MLLPANPEPKQVDTGKERIKPDDGTTKPCKSLIFRFLLPWRMQASGVRNLKTILAGCIFLLHLGNQLSFFVDMKTRLTYDFGTAFFDLTSRVHPPFA
jgi:hypothetical protein